MEAENVAPGHVYYLGIQYIFTVRPHSQLRRNLLESDGSGASRNTTTSTTYPNSTSDFIFYLIMKDKNVYYITYIIYLHCRRKLHSPPQSTKYFLMADKEIGVTRSWTATCLISG